MANYGRTINEDEVYGGPARILVQYRYPSPQEMDFFPNQINDIIDLTTTSPETAQGYWIDLGATDGGTTITIHSPLNEVRVDHQLIALDRADADASIATTLAEQSLANLKRSFSEDNVVATNVSPSPDEDVLDVDLNDTIEQFQMAVIGRKRNGKYKVYVFHTVQIEGGDIAVPFVPGGGLANIPVTFRALRRDTLTPRVFRIIDQLKTG